MIVVVLGVVVTGALVAAGLANGVWRERQRRVLDRLAERVGGTVRRDGALTGWALVFRRPGLGRVCLHHRVGASDAPDKSMRLEIEIPRLLPGLRILTAPSLIVGQSGTPTRPFNTGLAAFDEGFVAAPEGPGRAEALVDAALGTVILGLWEAGERAGLELVLRPSLAHGLTVLSIGHTGWLLEQETLAGFMEQGIVVAETIVGCWDGPWLAVAERLEASPALAEPSLVRGLQGRADGHRVEISELAGDPMHRTRISVAVDGIPGLCIALQDHAKDEGWLHDRCLTGNPVLDMLLAVRCEPSWQPLLQALLGDDALTELTLSVVHAHPGSLVTHQRVMLLVPGAPQGSLGGLVGQALALARALRAGMERHRDLTPPGAVGVLGEVSE